MQAFTRPKNLCVTMESPSVDHLLVTATGDTLELRPVPMGLPGISSHEAVVEHGELISLEKQKKLIFREGSRFP